MLNHLRRAKTSPRAEGYEFHVNHVATGALARFDSVSSPNFGPFSISHARSPCCPNLIIYMCAHPKLVSSLTSVL